MFRRTGKTSSSFGFSSDRKYGISWAKPTSITINLLGSMKISFFQSLRFRTPLWVLLGVIPPILIGISYGSSRTSKIIQANAEEQLASETQALSENVSRWAKMNVLALQNLSRQPGVISLDAKQQKPILEEFVKTYSHLYLASTTGINGINIARSDDEPPKDYNSRYWFQEAKAGKDITWEALIGKTSKKPAACFSTPIRQQKAVAAVVQGCSNLDEITQEVGAVKIGKTGYAIVVDNNGKVLAHPDPAFARGDNLADFSSYPPVKSLLDGAEGHLDFTDEQGTEWISYGTRLENGWGVVILQEKAEAFLQKQQFQKIASITSLSIVGLVVLIIFLIANRLVEPITRLTEASSAFAAGDLDRSVDLDRDDELGILADSFNKMTQQLKESIANLEKKADEQRQEKEQLETAIYTLLDEVSDATEGDLTVRASLSSMEISTVADLFNAIIDNLQEIAVEVKQSTNQVGFSLRENEEAIRILAEQAIAEAEETRKTLVSLEQMSQSIQEVAQNASQAAKISDDTNNTVLESSSAMDRTVDSILGLRTTVGETAKKMKRLGESSQKISQVVSLIEEIALKTNLLAINASVEASRAGEQGQGFTVVAEQVGALAEQSAAATKEIAQIVAAIQMGTQEVTQAMELGTAQVVDSTRLVESTKQSLGLVLEKSQEINQLMRSISEATVSQANTSQTVTDLMQQIAELSEASSASSKQVAQSMVTTAQVAQKLESTVAKFRVAEETETRSS
jgi:methyl-accepting chemotaxis protein